MKESTDRRTHRKRQSQTAGGFPAGDPGQRSCRHRRNFADLVTLYLGELSSNAATATLLFSAVVDERTEYIDIFLFSTHSINHSIQSIQSFKVSNTQSCSVSDVLFTGGRGVSDFSVLKYYYLNSVNILNEYLRILIDCSQLSKTYYVLFGSFTRDHHA